MECYSQKTEGMFARKIQQANMWNVYMPYQDVS